MQIHTDPKVEAKFKTYPEEIRVRLNVLRELILETASDYEHIKEIEETLKWGEPSFLVKKGSTIRINQNSKNPSQYAIYFKCTSKLVPTFKVLFGDIFNYENNRAILFDMDTEIPKRELKECIGLALTYHSVKNLPLLGK